MFFNLPLILNKCINIKIGIKGKTAIISNINIASISPNPNMAFLLNDF